VGFKNLIFLKKLKKSAFKRFTKQQQQQCKIVVIHIKQKCV